MRSRTFRAMAAGSFRQLLDRALGYRADSPLPPPASAAEALRARALEVVEIWAEQHGRSHPQARGASVLQGLLLPCLTGRQLGLLTCMRERCRRLPGAVVHDAPSCLQALEGHRSLHDRLRSACCMCIGALTNNQLK